MLSLQQLVDIAARHATAMADAMLRACVQRAVETGAPLRLTGEGASRKARGIARVSPPTPADDVDWERMVTGNRDTRWTRM